MRPSGPTTLTVTNGSVNEAIVPRLAGSIQILPPWPGRCPSRSRGQGQAPGIQA
jgi:hypothetical protein